MAVTGRRGAYKSNQNPPLSEESKLGILKYLSHYSTYDLSWGKYLKQENRHDLYGLRSRNASDKESKLYYKVNYYWNNR